MAAKKTPRKVHSASATSGIAPPARGGPANIGGVDFQLDQTVLLALELLGNARARLDLSKTLVLEPRIAADGSQGAWDLGVEPPSERYEVKSRPSRADVVEWLSRCVAEVSSNTRFALVCGSGGGLVTGAE